MSDSTVIGSWPMVSGYPMVGEDVGRRHGHHHHASHPAAGASVPASQLTPAQLDAMARARGFMLVPNNPNQGGNSGIASAVGHELLPTGQRVLPAGFTKASAVAAGGSFSLSTNIQRGFQARKLVISAVIDASGADAVGFLNITDIKVGQRTQIVSEGDLVPSMFQANAFDCAIILDPARTGNNIVINGTIAATATGPCTVKATAFGYSAD